MENGKVLEEEYNILGILDRHIVLEEPEILDEKQQKQIEDMCENYCPKNTEENTILKCRIDKAIEYIKHNQFIRYQVTLNPSYEMDDYQVKELLKILER